jgi:hypothetical protein
MVYERYEQPLLSRRAFVRRLVRHIAVALVVIGGSLLIGMEGYMALGGLSAVDAFLNASMLLGGMGPVNALDNDAAKIFAGTYALYSGIVFLVSAAIVATPVVHRILHKLNLDEDAAAGPGSEAT